jgi:hypothetical protein
MGEGAARRFTKILREYDAKLYAISRYGRIDVMRMGERPVVYDVDGVGVIAPIRNDWYIFSLTHDWTVTGRPVEWGALPLIEHLKAGDLWRRDVISDYFEAKSELDRSMDRSMDNKLEAFWKDNRRAWAKNFDQVNRSSLNPKDRRFDDDKKNKMKGL